MEAHVVYIVSLLSLFIHHQSLVAKERLEIRNHFKARSGYFQVLCFKLIKWRMALIHLGNLGKLIAVSRQWIPKILCRNLKIDIDVKPTMALRTAILKGNASKKYDENVKYGWTFWMAVSVFVHMAMTHAPKAVISPQLFQTGKVIHYR